MKKILILSSNYTGHGHKSIAASLMEIFSDMPDVEARVYESFDLMGSAAVRASKLYGPITRNVEEVWHLIFTTSQWSTKLTSETLEFFIHDKLMSLLRRWTPDTIISVHPLFNKCVLNIIEKYKLPIKFCTLIADIVDIHPNWVDKRADLICCPSLESYQYCLHKQIPKEKLLLCGFPTRQQFIRAAKNHEAEDYTPDRPLRCLVMSGGEGSGDMTLATKILLSKFNTHVSVICGRNEKLKDKIDMELLAEYPDRLKTYGFLQNVEDVMVTCDLVIARGSPNTMMEAVVLNVPLVITGSLPGQEAHNPEYAERYGLGIISRGIEGIEKAVEILLLNDGEMLNRIKRRQREFRSFENAKNIATAICDITEPVPFAFPHFRMYFFFKQRTRRRLLHRIRGTQQKKVARRPRSK